jgi:hypothetical protein
MNTHTPLYEVFRVPGKFLVDQTEEKMPTLFPGDEWGLNEARRYADSKLNEPSNISSEDDGVRWYFSTFVVRKNRG